DVLLVRFILYSFVMLPRATLSTLFPYTTLFRSLHGGSSGFIAAVRHQNDVDTWVMTYHFHRKEFMGYLVTSCGITGPVITKDERSEEHTSELQSRENLVCRLLLEKKKNIYTINV